ncbi:Hsp70 family protein [Patescibacteria group bacterium]|nr:Hsp70 family protein [Patescibacteria group bacterium]
MHYGLDFGTTNSAIAIKRDDVGNVVVVPVDPLAVGQQIMRSLLYVRKRKMRRFVGLSAVQEYLHDSRSRKPARYKVFDTGRKTIIRIPTGQGDFWNYETDITYREDINKPGQLIQALKTSLREGFATQIDLFGEKLSLEELIAVILRQMKETADNYLGRPINKVTLGRPVHYDKKSNDLYIEERMRQAAKLAGFTQISFVPEPVAAAYDYLQSRKCKEDIKIFVFDFGGGTLDFCLMNSKQNSSRVIATDGLSIGGDLFNELIMLHKVSPNFGTELNYGPKQLPMPAGLKQGLKKWYEIQALKSPNLSKFLNEVVSQVNEPRLIQNLITLIDYDLGFELFEALEKSKVELSTMTESVISFHQHDINLEIPITREEFEKFIGPKVSEIEVSINNLFRKADLEPDDIAVVVCTGGASYTPLIQSRLRKIFTKSNIVYHNVFQGIAAGLARVE